MKEAKSQLKKENPKQDRVFISNNILAMYVDITIRGMIAFLTLGLFSYFVLIKLFELPIWITLPIIFIGSVFMSPLLSKIRLGEKVQRKYDKFLKQVIKQMKK